MFFFTTICQYWVGPKSIPTLPYLVMQVTSSILIMHDDVYIFAQRVSNPHVRTQYPVNVSHQCSEQNNSTAAHLRSELHVTGFAGMQGLHHYRVQIHGRPRGHKGQVGC